MSMFNYIFLIGLICEEIIRFPHRKRQQRAWRKKQIAESRMSPLDFTLEMLAFTGMEIIPIIYIFSTWLSFADYSLPTWLSWIGVVVMVSAVWLLLWAHADLGRNWSPTVQIGENHQLVTHGVYSRVRHPIYAAVWLTAVAQALLLANWIAGPACLVLFLPVYLIRVPREEKMMLDHFGPAYAAYQSSTGRVVPRITAKKGK